uniref:Transmembrane protein 119 n=1 Tax=Serinus canaria TaxID=9135 RepID=A0A8C9MWY9_SERCA
MRTSWSQAATQEEKEEALSQQAAERGSRCVGQIPSSWLPPASCGRGEDPTGHAKLLPNFRGALEQGTGCPTARGAAVRAGHGPQGGTGDGGGHMASATLPAQPVTPRISPTVGEAPGTTVTNSSAPGVLDGLVDFFKEYLLLVVVVGSLSFVLLFIICAAVIVRQKHKASAYYPSSFPKKKYVDERDKSGGARAFSEVPDKAPEAGAEEPLDGGRQLQADILAAAQNLKSPHKAPLANGAQSEQNSPQEEEKEEEEEGKKKPAGIGPGPALGTGHGKGGHEGSANGSPRSPAAS